jgi:hypothetical protein
MSITHGQRRNGSGAASAAPAPGDCAAPPSARGGGCDCGDPGTGFGAMKARPQREPTAGSALLPVPPLVRDANTIPPLTRPVAALLYENGSTTHASRSVAPLRARIGT